MKNFYVDIEGQEVTKENTQQILKELKPILAKLKQVFIFGITEEIDGEEKILVSKNLNKDGNERMFQTLLILSTEEGHELIKKYAERKNGKQ